MAQLNTKMFEMSGLSYPWAPVEDSMASVAPLPERDRLQETVWPSATSSILSRIEDRRRLLARLMSRSPSWERDLGNILGGVSFLEIASGDKDLARAMGADENGCVMLGRPANPWRELEQRKMPFLEPICLDAMFSDKVEEGDVRMTPTYRDMHPWLFDDTDELLVAQWHHDLTGAQLWAGSWLQYQIAAGQLKEDDVTEFRDVKKKVKEVRSRRTKLFGVDLKILPRQLSLWRST